ncbi:MAG: TetR/AcrR family transcriptional regulator [Terrimicrobiaceae bacterium]
MANESRERLLAGAKQLFLARGYAGTTVDAICEKAELTKGSFYHFFDSKEELALAVLDWSLQRGGQVLARGGPNQIADPVERAFAFLEHLEECSPELWSGGCLLGSFALELADTNPRMQQAVAEMFQAVTDDFAEKLQPIAAHCAGNPAPTAAELADTLLGTLEGSSSSPRRIAISPASPRPFADSDSRWAGWSSPKRSKFFAK